MRHWVDKIREEVKGAFSRTSPQARVIALSLAGAVAIALIAWIAFFRKGPDFVKVWEDLDPSEVSEMANLLVKEKIEFKLSPEADAILIRKPDADKARVSMASQGLPKHGTIGFEVFSETRLGATDFEKRISYVRALQGELARTIVQVRGVQSARVHVVLPQESVFASRSSPSSVAVFLKLKPGATLESDQVLGIMHLVSKSVDGLKPHNVTVVDSSGKILSAQAEARLRAAEEEDAAWLLGGGSAMDLSEIFNLKSEYEARIEYGLQSVLEPVFGPGNVLAKVSSELDFNRQTIERDVFEPQDVSETLRSIQEVEEGYRGTGLPPGMSSESGVPGYQAIDQASGTADYSRKESTRNYELGRTAQRTLVAPGSLKRLTVAVVVNRRLEPEMVTAVTNVVSAAIGADPAHDDLISVEGIPFDTSLVDSLQRENETLLPMRSQWIKYAWAAAALLAAFLLLNAALRKKRARKAPYIPGIPEAMLGTGLSQYEDDLLLSGSRSRALATVEDWARKKPQLVARGLQRWLSE